MSKPTYDAEYWEDLWQRTIREHGDKVSRRPPSSHLTAAAQTLRPGRALDAGCGHGAESLWLAAHGWHVTAVDFSPAALEHAQRTAEAAGRAIAERVEFVCADLTSWAPDARAYDLVASLYVHVPGRVEDMVRRLSRGVAAGGVLLLAGHQAVDPATGAPTRAAGQTQVSLESAIAALEPRAWTLVTAEHRPRAAGGGVDAVILARRIDLA